MSPSRRRHTPCRNTNKPEGDSGYVAFKKATYPLSQYQAEPDIAHDQNHVATVALPRPRGRGQGSKGAGVLQY
ncbi:hypothetical protein Taro_047223 [Colocasia esculenta]|uniref:Uncharacterized protein n=1 Tax=Colocasia esculenta TaxID=4460 RepID=A0A843X6G6_COLES|nr:hypothetical protein [Colocasia esculenta]